MSVLLNGLFDRKDNSAKPFASVELIGPEEAERLLAANNNNYRNIRRKLVERYKSDMLNDMWTLTTGAIGFSVDGTLTNGQHRLTAVFESGVPCWFIVVQNLPANASQDPNEDTGSRRSIASHLQNKGVVNASSVAATARFLWGMKTSGKKKSANRANMSDAMIARIVASDERIVDAASAVRCCSRVAMSSVAGAWYWLASFENKELADECCAILSGSAECSTSHPFSKLRDILLQAKFNRKSQGGMSPDLQFRSFISAWEKAKSGVTVKLLRPANTIKISDEADYALQVMGQ